MTFILQLLLLLSRPVVLIGAPPAPVLRCVCGCPESDHADADYTGLTWCTGCGCSYFQPYNPDKWWGFQW